MSCMHRLCLALAVGSAVGAGGLLARTCLSELGALLAAQVCLILLWCLARRPFVSATRFYLLCCFVFLVRETVLTISGQVPCGLSVFGNTCTETVCAEYHRIPILGIKTSCARYECGHHAREETSQVFTSAESLNKWTATALLCVWAAFAISYWHLRRHWQRVRSKRREDPTAESKEFEYMSVILAVPITYGLCAMHALRVLSVSDEDAWQAEGMMSAAELYSALALLAFQKLLEVYVKTFQLGDVAANYDVESDCKACQHRALAVSHHDKVRGGFQQLVAMGIKQYVVLVFGCNALEVVAKAWNWANPQWCRSTLTLVAATLFPHHEISLTLNQTMVEHTTHTAETGVACEDLWNVMSLLMVVANFFTCSIALYAVLQYEGAFAALLEPARPFWKFWGVKGLLSVNFFQRIALMTLGALASSSPQLTHEFRTFLNFFLVCVESAVLAMVNVSAYALPPDEHNAKVSEAKGVMKPLGVLDDLPDAAIDASSPFH